MPVYNGYQYDSSPLYNETASVPDIVYEDPTALDALTRMAYDEANLPNLRPFSDLSVMMAGESGIDEQWRSFLRDSGLLDYGQNVNTSSF